MKTKTVLFLLFVLLLPSLALSAADGQAFEKARQSYRELINSSSKQLYRHNWEKVIDRLLAFRNKYPRSDRADDALYLAAKANQGLYRVSVAKGFATAAVGQFRQVADLYPGSNLADDALFRAAEMLESDLRSPREAYQGFARIVRDFPGTDMAPAARQKMALLARYAPPSNPAVSKKAPRAPAVSTGPSTLRAVRSSSHPGGTRIVLEFDRPTAYSWNSLGGKNPRIYVDLKGVKAVRGLPGKFMVGSSEVKAVRTGIQKGERIRVVLDLARPQEGDFQTLSNPDRILIDVGGAPESSPESGDAIAGMLGRTAQQKAPRVQVKQSGSDGQIRRVVIDAGHGGKDPGAVGKAGTLEKNVALAIVRKTAKLLKRKGNIEVILTRDNDTYLPLSERTSIANKLQADLFISVHANASEKRSVYGVETYYLNFSKNDQAASVAARENNTSLKEVGDLELILFDLMANSKINESSRLAGIMQKSLVKELSGSYSKIRDMGVKQGPFYVLLGATMPSVLVEAAFISNKREEARLKSGKYQDRVARAIVKAVNDYARSQQLTSLR